MPTLEIIKAWKDEEYRDTLTADQRALMPKHPAGDIELGDAEAERENAFKPVRAACFPSVPEAGLSFHLPPTYNKGCRK